MAVFAAEITKRRSIRGSQEEFANVYHYSTNVAEAFDDDAVINALAAAEKLVHSGDVAFVRGRTWGPTDGPAFDNIIRETFDLTGSGSVTGSGSIHVEGVVVVRWDLPRSPATNRRRWLRKYLHVGILNGTVTSAVTSGAVEIPTANRAAYVTYAQTVQNLTGAGSSEYQLCTADGAEYVPNTERVMPYVTIHDLKY